MTTTVKVTNQATNSNAVRITPENGAETILRPGMDTFVQVGEGNAFVAQEILPEQEQLEGSENAAGE